ncbi:MAG: class I SAM-dependent methyltransferase [Bacteroidia bacterium]|nr:class I SAM-dependent methyltransferase [Bacteroidia bacterium]
MYRLLSRSKKNLRALDIGSEMGKLFYVLEREGFETWGIEPSPTFRKRAIELGFAPPDRLILASVEEAEFPPEHFDFITFSAVFEHLYYPGEVLRKVLRWLKPDGVIHVEVPSANWLIAKLLNTYYRLIGTDYTTHLSPMHPPLPLV